MAKLDELRKELKQLANAKQAKILSGFFKTGKGEYGEGDIFYGIKVPVTRKVATNYWKEINLQEVQTLMDSKNHEERLIALLILILKFEDKKLIAKEKTQREIFEIYLGNTHNINNWDLVDLSAPNIVGKYLFEHSEKKKEVLLKLAKSKLLWEKRIAMVSCYYFIKNKQYAEALEVAELLLKEEHDLLHKAVGWMLREVGKKEFEVEENFLKKHYKEMPRTMLRYAIERFPEEKRKKYLEGKI